MSPPIIPDAEAVARIIRDVAQAEIIPRFQALAAHEISEKSPGQVVTIADTEAEKALAGALTELQPGCAVLGEEGFEAAPETFRALSEDKPVWVLDPVDGTQNFANGKPCFAVIVAYCVGGETLAGWIYDPVNDITIHGIKGQGAWRSGQRLKVAPPAPLGAMNGSLAFKFRRRIADAGHGKNVGEGGTLLRMGCVGREYMDLAAGRLHFARYAGKLKPWDHAAGVLIHAEAGGYSAMTDNGGPYEPAVESHTGALILAPDRDTWQALHAALTHP